LSYECACLIACMAIGGVLFLGGCAENGKREAHKHPAHLDSSHCL